MKNQQSNSFLNAKKRVEGLRAFYKHLTAYLVVNGLLLILKWRLLEILLENGNDAPGFVNWFEWNVIATPVLWGIGLGVHALYVFVYQSGTKSFKPEFLNEWENRQIKKYMEEEGQ